MAGAGSAGCVLARRLAQSGATVILLEAGGPDRTRLVRKPGMIAIFHNVPALKKRLDWGYYTAPQASALGRRIPQPRGRVLGGSGSINGMLFVRGNRKNYDDWAVPGWSYDHGLIADQVSLELNPGPGYPDRAALAAELPNRATSVYHAVGTCRMGTDERCVVDPALRVRGIDGLRVADASIMPSITGGNTNAPAMMIGEHCAALMRAKP